MRLWQHLNNNNNNSNNNHKEFIQPKSGFHNHLDSRFPKVVLEGQCLALERLGQPLISPHLLIRHIPRPHLYKAPPILRCLSTNNKEGCRGRCLFQVIYQAVSTLLVHLIMLILVTHYCRLALK